MNETLKTINERRAVRKYKDKPVERKLIDQIIEAGRMAPTALNKQPWKFYVLTDKTLIKSFSKQIAKASFKAILKMGFKEVAKGIVSFIHSPHDFKSFKADDFVFHEAPVVIFITSPKDNEWAPLDIGMCSQNMMLAAKSLGLDSCPVGFGKFVEQTKLFSKLNVPENEMVNLSIIFGYGDETPGLKERKKDNVSFID